MHTPVSDAQYFAALPPNGLQLADQFLQQDYEQLQENDLPVAGTVAGVLTVHSLQQEEVDA